MGSFFYPGAQEPENGTELPRYTWAERVSFERGDHSSIMKVPQTVRGHRCINVKAQQKYKFSGKSAREARAGVIVLYIPQIIYPYVARNFRNSLQYGRPTRIWYCSRFRSLVIDKK